MAVESETKASASEQDEQMADASVLTKEQLYKKQRDRMLKQLHMYKQQVHYFNGIPYADCCDPLPNNH